MPPFRDDGRRDLLHAIRDALAQGDDRGGHRLLGYDWFVIGEVAAWREARAHARLSDRQYAARPRAACARHLCGAGRRGGSALDGVASFGRRPTFDNGAPLLEAFLFDFDGDLYGKAIEVAFVG